MNCRCRCELMLTPVSVTYRGTPYAAQRTSTCNQQAMHVTECAVSADVALPSHALKMQSCSTVIYVASRHEPLAGAVSPIF